MAGDYLDFIPTGFAELSTFWEYFRWREYLGSDVEHGAGAFVADSDSVLLFGGAGGNRAGARLYVADCYFHAFDCAARAGTRDAALKISATGSQRIYKGRQRKNQR